MKNFKYTLQERLNYYVECKNGWLEYFKHQEVSEKAKKRFYDSRKIFSLFAQLYFLPLNLLEYYKKKEEQNMLYFQNKNYDCNTPN